MRLQRYSAAVTLAGGALTLLDRRDFARALRSMPDGPGVLTIAAQKRPRSLAQNAYWWGFIVPPIAEHCGYTPSQMHYALLGECFGFIDGPRGIAIPVKPSSSDLSVAEFQTLIDWALIWAPAELGVRLPGPDDVGEADGA